MTISEAEVIIKTEEAKEEKELENKTAFVKKLLNENIFTAEKIADLADVTVDFVLKIKEQLSSK